MVKNKFFFRDEYTLPEKEKRIPVGAFTTSNSEVAEIISADSNITVDEIRNLGKEDLLHLLKDDLGEERYTTFIGTMFEEYGKKGDKFNLKMYSLPPEGNYENFSSRAEGYEEERMDSTFGKILSQPLYCKKVKVEQGRFVDFKFKLVEESEDFEPDGTLPIQILNEKGEVVEEVTGNHTVRAPANYPMEARVYIEEKLLVVSNSGGTDSLRNEIRVLITSMIRGNQEVINNE